MEWQQKAEALSRLAEISIKMRKVNDWYVSQRTEIGGNGFLTGSYGNGETPQAAVEDHWRVLVDDLSPDKYISVNGNTEDEKRFRWNGYMWSIV